jgi:pimeloyl-ACP methyl ester carboxylesterase
MSTSKHVFSSKGDVCEASLALPDTPAPAVIVLGHGFAAERGFGTAAYIKAFVTAGYAVFSFDYRNFGGSQGLPRQLVDPQRHLEDWYNAIQYVRSLSAVDPNRMVLWGSSYGGGHVLATAARFHRLAGVIAQVPYCNARSMGRTSSLGKKLASAGHALLDRLLSLVGRCHTVAVVGEPGEGFAVLDWPGWKAEYLRLASASSTWRNAIPARSLLRLGNYNPADSAGDITCPVLVVSGSQDQGVPREDILDVVSRIPDCHHVEWDFDHFDLYDGWELADQCIEQQLRFLDELFSGPGTPAG